MKPDSDQGNEQVTARSVDVPKASFMAFISWSGTFYASRGARQIFGNAKYPRDIKLPIIIGGYPPSKLKIRMVAKIGTFAGRAVPVVGWAILASDVSQIIYRTVKDYNRIARGSDKLW